MIAAWFCKKHPHSMLVRRSYPYGNPFEGARGIYGLRLNRGPNPMLQDLHYCPVCFRKWMQRSKRKWLMWSELPSTMGNS